MKIMLIDGENCYSNELIKRVRNRRDWEVIIVIGRDQTHNIPDNANIDIERCEIVGHNAADFRIIAELTHKIFTQKYEEAVIVSNDKGFDSAVEYIKKQGIRIRRLSYQYMLSKFGSYNPSGKRSRQSVKSGYNSGSYLNLKEELLKISEGTDVTKRITLVPNVHVKNDKNTLKLAKLLKHKCRSGGEFNRVLKMIDSENLRLNVEEAFRTLANDKVIRVYRSEKSGNYHIGWHAGTLETYCKLIGG